MFSGQFGVQRKTGPVEARQGQNVLRLLVTCWAGICRLQNPNCAGNTPENEAEK